MTDDNNRTHADERRRLIAELELERKQLIRNIETCRIRDIDRPFIDQWSLQDIVGHVATWEAEVTTAFRELKAGQRPRVLDFDYSAINHWNQDHVERKRDLNFWAVYEQLKGGRQRLLEELDLVPDDDLAAEGSIHLRLVQSTIDHDREHWHQIAAKLAGMAGARSTGRSIPEEASATN
ncbi:MAG: DinB family protein [Tepidiformaceae bacterium]